VLEQCGLPDSGLPAQHEAARLAVPGTVEQALDRVSLALPPDQHRLRR
jgi:hypothetical protein